MTRIADLTPEQRERRRATQRKANQRYRESHPRPPRKRLGPGDKAAYMRRYRREHRAEAAAYMASYRPTYLAAKRDAINARRRAAYAADPSRAIARATRWKDQNPSRARAIRMAAAANRRAAEYGAHGRLSPDDVTALWRRQPACIMCGDGAGLDHVIPFCRGGSNTTGNIQNLCRDCNSRKGRKLPAELVS